MSWLFFQRPPPPKIAYLALCFAIFAFFTPGMYFVAMDENLPERAVALKGFLLGMIISCISLALSILAIFYYRNKNSKEGAKFARSVIIVSSVILIFHIGIFAIFLLT